MVAVTTVTPPYRCQNIRLRNNRLPQPKGDGFRAARDVPALIIHLYTPSKTLKVLKTITLINHDPEHQLPLTAPMMKHNPAPPRLGSLQPLHPDPVGPVPRPITTSTQNTPHHSHAGRPLQTNADTRRSPFARRKRHRISPFTHSWLSYCLLAGSLRRPAPPNRAKHAPKRQPGPSRNPWPPSPPL